MAYGDNTESHQDGFYLDDITIYDASGMAVSTQNPITNNTQIQVYPNPTNNDIYIEWKKEIPNGNLSIYDKTGRLIYTNNITQNTDYIHFNTNKLPSGIYIIQLQSAQHVAIKRFVKM